MSDEWIRPPRLRTRGAAEGGERHATWLELFFDLVFVAAVGRLAHVLGEDVSWNGVFAYVLLFVPVWWSWIGATFYSDRFDTDDLADRVLALGQMGAAAAMAVNVDHALGSSGAAFALSYAGFRLILVIQYLVAARHAPQTRPLSRRFALGFGIAAALWAVSALVPAPLRYVLWAAGIVVDLLTPTTAGRRHAAAPADTTHLPERFGLFIIIVLGEAVVAVVTTLDRKVWGVPGAAAAFLALVMAFSLWWIYFGNLDGTAIRAARREGRTWVYQAWLYAHFPLAAAIAAAGVGVGHALAVPPEGVLETADRWLICGAFAVCILAIGALDRIYAAAGSARSSSMQAVWRVGGAALALLVGAIGADMHPAELMGCLAALGIVQVVTDPPRHRNEIDDGDEDENDEARDGPADITGDADDPKAAPDPDDDDDDDDDDPESSSRRDR